MIGKVYVARPVSVEAVIWTGDNFEEIKQFANGMVHLRTNPFTGTKTLMTETLEDTRPASIGDYIVRGTVGEFYPVKPHIFEGKYEAVT